jgi:Tfp pilus assembly protein PilX
MNNLPKSQRGMVLVVGLIMLLLLTLMVSTMFNLSSTNLLGVGNQQWRSEALAASNAALEQVIGSAFTTAPTAESIDIDINHDNTQDYLVQIAAPLCVRATLAGAAAPSSLSLVGMSNLTWNTVWDLDARVQDAATGASVRVRTGVRVLLSDAQKLSVCL